MCNSHEQEFNHFPVLRKRTENKGQMSAKVRQQANMRKAFYLQIHEFFSQTYL